MPKSPTLTPLVRLRPIKRSLLDFFVARFVEDIVPPLRREVEPLVSLKHIQFLEFDPRDDEVYMEP